MKLEFGNNAPTFVGVPVAIFLLLIFLGLIFGVPAVLVVLGVIFFGGLGMFAWALFNDK